jgi:hypothetical protein
MEKRGDGLEPRLPGARPTHAALTPPSPSTAPPGARPMRAALTPPSHRYGPCPPQPDLGLQSSGRGRPDLSGGGGDRSGTRAERRWRCGGAAPVGARLRPPGVPVVSVF